MDILSDVLQSVRLTEPFSSDIQASEPWVAERPPANDSRRDVSRLRAPDLLSRHHRRELLGMHAESRRDSCPRATSWSLPHGDTHVLTSTPVCGTPDMAMYRVPRDGHLPVSISMGDPKGEAVHFVCGFLGDARPYNPCSLRCPGRSS